jgi:signal transduction histidine kinase
LDEGLMRNIIINLLVNAIKFSPEANEVDFSVVCDKQTLTIQIRDYGVGIPEEDIDKLFQAFFRSKNVGAIAGTGLGLSIVKKAVSLLDGDIQVKSRVDLGTEFIVTLPIFD